MYTVLRLGKLRCLVIHLIKESRQQEWVLFVRKPVYLFDNATVNNAFSPYNAEPYEVLTQVEKDFKILFVVLNYNSGVKRT
jgi:hypothetical protein